MKSTAALIKKELMAHLMSFQFAALLLSAVVLFTAAGVISGNDFASRKSVYSRYLASAERKASTVEYPIYRRPSILQFMDGGGKDSLPYSYELSPMGRMYPLAEGAYNKKMPAAPDIDWALIIKLVFTLFAFLFGFGAVSAEKERGTLRLVLSYPIARVRILVAKYLAILLVLLIPLFIGGLVGLLIAGIYDQGLFTIANVSRILLMFALSVVFISAFVLLSLLVSSLVASSSASLFILLSIWMLFIIVIPNSAGIIAEHIIHVPSEYQHQLNRFLSVAVPGNNKAEEERVKYEKGEIKTEQEFRKRMDPIFREGYELWHRTDEDFLLKIKRQAAVSRLIVRSSPVGVFQFAAEDLSMTGKSADDKFEAEALQYSKVYDRYIENKVGKLVPGTFANIMTYLIRDGQFITIAPPQPSEYKGDMSDFPQFVEKGPTLLESLKNALFDLAGLLVWNIVLALLAFGAFLKADVR